MTTSRYPSPPARYGELGELAGAWNMLRAYSLGAAWQARTIEQILIHPSSFLIYYQISDCRAQDDAGQLLR